MPRVERRVRLFIGNIRLICRVWKTIILGLFFISTNTAHALEGIEDPTQLRMLVSWPSSFVLNSDVAALFASQINDESRGDIKISVYGPDVVPTFEQISPVQDGVFQLLVTHPSYHSGTVAAGISIDGVKAGIEERRTSGVWRAYDTLYRSHGLKLIAMPQLGDRGLQFVLKEPLDETDGLMGKVVRGTVSFHPLIRKMGGAPIVLSAGELYSGLDRGVIDGAGFATFGVPSLRLNEVADYLLRPAYGTTCNLILMHLETWESLSQERQEFLLSQGELFERESNVRFNQIIADEEALLLDRGMRLDFASDRFAESMDLWWAEGAWAAAASIDPEETAALKQAVSEAGMLVTGKTGLGQ